MISILEFLAKKHLEISEDISIISKLQNDFKYNPFQTTGNFNKVIILKYWVDSKDDCWINSREPSDFSSIESFTNYLKSFYENNNYLYFAFTSYLILNTKDSIHYEKYKEYEKLITSEGLLIDKEEQGNDDIEIFIHIKDFEKDFNALYNVLSKLKANNIIN